MPRLDLTFADSVDKSIKLAEAGEIARIHSVAKSVIHKQFYPARLEYLYELAFLRIFISWEEFLEQTVLRYMIGQQSRHGKATLTNGRAYHRSLADAEVALLSGKQFLLWYKPTAVINRVRGHIDSGLHENVISAARSNLEFYAAIRHRIAHGQEHAKREFDNATNMLVGRRYSGSRAGRFLRETDTSQTPNVRWIVTISRYLTSIASAIV